MIDLDYINKMPQEMNVLCCYSCKMYQVQIVKKARKWQCKLCNAKQSIRQVYFQGSGKECRLHVQRLNYTKVNNPSLSLHSEQNNSNDKCDVINIPEELNIDKPVEDKWSKYLDPPKENDLFDVEYSFSNICEVENSSKESLCNVVNKDSYNYENTQSDSKSENITNETEDPCSVNLDSNIEDKYNLQDNDKSSSNNNVIANIFETYSELDDPLI